MTAVVPDAGLFAGQLQAAFDRVRKPTGERYSDREAAEAIRAKWGYGPTAAHLWQMRNGERGNPNMRTVVAVADFFGLDPGFFYGVDPVDRLPPELVRRLAEPRVQQEVLALLELPPRDRQLLADLVLRVRSLHGYDPPELPPAAVPAPRARRVARPEGRRGRKGE